MKKSIARLCLCGLAVLVLGLSAVEASWAKEVTVLVNGVSSPPQSYANFSDACTALNPEGGDRIGITLGVDIHEKISGAYSFGQYAAPLAGFTLHGENGKKSFHLYSQQGGVLPSVFINADQVEMSNIHVTGITITGDNLGDTPSNRPAALRVNLTDATVSRLENMSFSNNRLSTTAVNSVTRIFGSGLHLLGTDGASLQGDDLAKLEFRNIEFLNNATSIDASRGSAPTSVLSAGAGRLAGLSDLAVTNLTVRGNSVSGTENVVVSAGGGIGVEFNNSSSKALFRNAVFKNNSATLSRGMAVNSAYAARGGALHGAKDDHIDTGLSVLTLEHSEFSGNSARGAGNALAMGGAAHFFGSIKAVFADTAFSENKAVAKNGDALGGALALEAYDSLAFIDTVFSGEGQVVLHNAVLADNTAQSGSGNAYGGALYIAGGKTLPGEYHASFINSTLTGNRAVSATGNARGGAAYFDTSREPLSVLVKAEQNRETLFAGNMDGSGRNSLFFNGSGSAVLDLVTEKDAAIRILDPIAANMTGARFTANIQGAGTTYLGGLSRIDASGAAGLPGAVFNVADGASLSLMKDFQLALPAGTETQLVLQGAGAQLLFDAARNNNNAIVSNVRNGSGQGRFTLATNGGVIGVAMERRLSDVAAGQEFLFINSSGASSDPFGSFNDWTRGEGVERLEARQSVPGSSSHDQLWLVTKHARSRYADEVESNVNTASAASSFDKISGSMGSEEWGAVKSDLHAITPEYALSSALVNRAVTQLVVNAVYNEYFTGQRPEALEQGLESTRRVQLWGGYIGNFGKMDRHSGRESYKTDMHGFVGGGSVALTPQTRVGIYGAYMDNKLDYRSIDAKVDSRGYQFGVLFRHDFLSGWSVTGDAGYANFDNDGERTIGNKGKRYKVSSDFDQDVVTAGLGIEKHFSFKYVTFSPYLRGRYSKVKQEGATESGNSLLAARVSGFNGESCTSELGFAVSGTYELQGLAFTPSLRAGWIHEFGDRDLDSSAYYLANPKEKFTVYSAKEDRNRFSFGADAKVSFLRVKGYEFSAVVGYDHQNSSNFRGHSISAGIEIKF